MSDFEEKPKTCTKCGENKPLSSYVASKRNKSGVQSECKSCASARVRTYQKANDYAEKQRERRSEQKQLAILEGRRSENRPRPAQDQIMRYRAYKESRPCLDCGRSFPYYVMQFDHTSDDKLFQVSSVLKHHHWSAMWAEIEKCDLVCACCHRLRTESRGFKHGSADPLKIDYRARSRTSLQEGVDKQCSTCFRWLAKSAFWQIREGRLSARCRDCALNAQAKWRSSGGLARILSLRSERRRVGRQDIFTIKDGSRCLDCGEAKSSVAMDFDHVGEKTENVSRLVNNGVTLDRLRKEIAQCELVCANCHQIRTHQRRTQKDVVVFSGIRRVD